MPSRTIIRTQGGVSKNLTVNRDRKAAVTTMSRTGQFSDLDQDTTSMQVTVEGHANISGIYTGTTVAGATWTQQGGSGTITASNFNSTDGYEYLLEDADSDPQTLLNTGTGFTSRPWEAILPNGITITGVPQTITVDRTAPVVTSDRAGESRPILSKVVGGASAAYSLRDLNDKQGNNKVVRVRRESDNHERDFLAKEVSNGTLESFVNAQTTAPLDTKALTSTGRNGNFLIAKAAYSLRSLGTRQATVTSSGDTDGDTSGKFVCQVRKDQVSTTDDTKSFTADEVSDGTLVDFILGNTKSLLNSRAYFDGSNDNVKLTSEINLTGDFSLKYSFVVTIANQQIIGKEIGGSYIRAGGNNGIQNFRISTDGAAATLTLTSNLKYGVVNTVKLKRVSGKFGIYDENDNLISAEFTNSDTFTVQSFGRARGTYAKGVVYNIRIDTNNDGTINHSYNGYGNTLSDWTDLVGSNDAAIVNGSPALFTGQDQNGFVKTWYDQSVSDQAGSATGNHATQSDTTKQPKIVSAGSLNADGGLEFDGINDLLSLTSSINFQNKPGYVVALQDGQDSVNDFTLGASDSNRGVGFKSNKTRWFFANLTIDIDNSSVQTGQKLYTALHDGTTNNPNVKSYVNSSEIIDSNPDPDQGQVNVSTLANQVGARKALSFLEGTLSELIIYDTDQTDNRSAIEANIGEHYSLSGVPAFDNTVSGFVETWYDQSGNGRDSTNTTATQQPIIVDSGLFQDGLKFTHTDTTNGKRLFVPRSAAELGDSFALVFVGKVTASDSSINNLLGGTRGVQGFAAGSAGISIRSDNGTVSFVNEQDSSTRVISSSSTTVSLDTDFVAFATYEDAESGPDLDFSVNGNKQDFGFGSNLVLTSSKDIGIMNATGNTNSDSNYRTQESPTGICREALVYDTAQFDNRVALETNIINHYGIS